MIDGRLQNIIDEYVIGLKYSDFDDIESYEYEDVFIPFRKYLESYPEALDKIVEADKKLIQGYEALPKGYFKDILKEVYLLAKQNVEAHQDAA